MLIRQEIHATHYNDNYWLKPELFEPDRFNFDSEFYKESKKIGKTGPSHSKRSFGVGMRSCPGKTFAFLEIKIAVIVITTLIDYTIDDELMNKKGAFFGIGSEIPAEFTVVDR